MAYTNQTVEEILVLARHGALKKTQKNCALVEALGQDILGSLDDDEPYETFLDFVRDLRRKRTGIPEMEVALTLRRLDDEALAMADFVDRCGCQRLGSDHREESPR
jgi:hypothetical protein